MAASALIACQQISSNSSNRMLILSSCSSHSLAYPQITTRMSSRRNSFASVKQQKIMATLAAGAPKRRELLNEVVNNVVGSHSTAEEVTQGISLASKVAIVTGGSSGIGYETSRVLANRECHVIIACEDLSAAKAARNSIISQNRRARVTALHLNLASFASVRDFINKFKSLNLPLHILINNAGIARSNFGRSEDGLELTFAVNHVGHFLLTNSLLDFMDETANSCSSHGRIVIVSSSQHDSASGIDFDKLHENHWMFSVPILQSVHGLSTVYAQSKLANILHAKELARRLKEQGRNITVNALHPGVFNTSFIQKWAEPAVLAFWVVSPLLKTVEQGAATTCYLAAHPAVEGVSGKYFADCKETTGSRYSNDMQLAKKLWEYTEALIQ